MFPVSRILPLSAALALCATSALAQNVISAKSGLVHYVEGDVTVNGQAASDQAGTFSDIKKGGDLATALGRAEVLMTPGVFLRVAEQSSIRMLDTHLSDTRVELLSGKVMLESDTPMKDNQVTVLYKDYATTFLEHGLYEFQTEPAQLMVYSGKAQVTVGGQTVTVKEGRTLVFTAALAQERFNPKEGDSLYRWSKLRSEYISVANVSAARSAMTAGGGYGYNAAPGFLGDWYFNPFYNMYTYLPFRGTYYSPFGFAYFSPFTVYQAYAPYYYNNYYGGGGGGGSKTPSSAHSVHSTVLTSASHPTASAGTRGGSVSPGGSGISHTGGGISHGGASIGHVGGGAVSSPAPGSHGH